MNPIIIGKYSNTKYSFVPGTRKITIFGLDGQDLDLENILLISNQTQKELYATPGEPNITIGYAKPTVAAIAAVAAGGAVTAGDHSYYYTFVYSNGEESLPSPVSNIITTTTGNLTVNLSNVSVGDSSVVARNIYRTKAGNIEPAVFVGTISDNTTTTYTDTIADTGLSVIIQTLITSTVLEITIDNTFSTLNLGDKLLIKCFFNETAKDESLDILKVGNLFESDLPPSDPEIQTISDTNLATTTTTYFYEIFQGLWKNLVIQLIASCSGTGGIIKLYKTLDAAAVVPTNGIGATPSASSWIDCTEEKFGVNELSIFGSNVTHIYQNLSVGPNGNVVDMPDRYLLSWKPTNVSNSISANIRKF